MAKGKARPYFWNVSFQRFVQDHDGTAVAVTPQRTLRFPDGLLYETQRKKSLIKGDDPLYDDGTVLLVRKGAIGILDALLAAMRQLSQQHDTKKKGKR